MRIYFENFLVSRELEKFGDSCPTMEEYLTKCREFLTEKGLSFDSIHQALIDDYDFTTEFWAEKSMFFPGGKTPNGQLFVIEGACYYKADREQTGGAYRGFGGRSFTIRVLATGGIVKTSDLWFNGKIPPRFRDRMPDTAEFVN